MTPLTQFTKTVKAFYKNRKRDMPWRKDTSPYSIVVSEIMLQQTQVSRVVSKYENWMKLFPSFKALSEASTAEVLKAWQGLGYNRRGLYLHQIAKIVTEKGFPQTKEELVELPGIGPNTAGAILTYAFNQPVVFIETNIRSVFIHHFFPKKKNVHDKDLLPLIEKSIDRKKPREWYWALMDYGTHLKATEGNASIRSKHYTKQSTFKGSRRQLRAAILSFVLQHESLDTQTIFNRFPKPEYPLKPIIEELHKEGFFSLSKGVIKVC